MADIKKQLEEAAFLFAWFNLKALTKERIFSKLRWLTHYLDYL